MGLTMRIFIGLILGVVAGMGLGPGGVPFAKAWIAPFGTIFMNMIKMIIVPLVLSSLVIGVCGLGDVKKIGRIGGITVFYYLITTAVAIVIGLILGTVVVPGAGLSIPSNVKTAAKAAPPIMDVISGIFPTNPVQAMVKADMLQIIVFALFLGVGIIAVGDRAKPLYNFFDGLAEVSYKIVGYIMVFAPIGVFGLICPVVAANGPAVLLPLLKVILCVYVGCFLHAIIVYGGLLSIIGKLNPMKFFKAVFPAQMIAFTSCSSSGTLPVTMECTQTGLGVAKEIASFVLPLGATINMDGTALYQGVCALFIAQVYGVDLSAAQYATIIVTGTLASIGTAGVPGAGFIMLTMILTAIGLPLEGSALIAGIDRVLDMPRTCVNITGDCCVAYIVDKSEKDRAKRLEGKEA